VIKEFSVVSPAAKTIAPFVAIATVVRPFLFSALLPTPPSPFSLPLTLTVIVYSSR